MAFPIKCSDCKKSFSISDDVYDRKVRGKLVTIKCKSCGAAIRVDGTKATDAPQPATPPAEAKSKAPAKTAGANESTAASAEIASHKPATPPTAAVTKREVPRAQKPLISSPTKPGATGGALRKDIPKAAGAKAAPDSEEKPAGMPAGMPATEAAKSTGKAPVKPAGTRDVAKSSSQATPSLPQPPRVASRKSVSASKKATKPPPTSQVGSTSGARSTAKPSQDPADENAILWAVDYGESEHRELTTAEIGREIKTGAIDGQTLVWHDNMPDWLAISDVKELCGFVEKAPNVRVQRKEELKSKPKPKPKPPPAPKSAPRTSAGTHGLPSVPKAAPPPPLGPLSSQRPAPSPPKGAASRPPTPPKKAHPDAGDQDEVITSARLIDDETRPEPTDPFAGLANAGAPAAGFGADLAPAKNPLPDAAVSGAPGGFGVPPNLSSGSAPASPAPANPAQGAAYPGPASAAQPPPLPQAGGAAAAPQLNAGFGAPSALAAPVSALPATNSALTDDIEWPQTRSKKPLVIGVMGVTAVILIGWLLASGSDDDAPIPDTAAPETQGAAPAPAEPTPPSPAPAEPTAEEGATEDAPAAPAESPNSKSGDFADLFEQKAKGSR